MKSTKILFQVFSLFAVTTSLVALSSAHALGDTPDEIKATIAEDCTPSGDGCDVDSCKADYAKMKPPGEAPMFTCGESPNGGEGGPTGVPAGAMGGKPQTAVPGTGPATPPFVSCPLNTKDSFADEMKQVMAEVKVACPNIGNSTDIIDKYISSYVNQDMNLPQGITCQNYNTVLADQLKEAQQMSATLNAPPNNAYSQCWVYTYNPDSNISIYQLQGSDCFQSVTGPIRQQIIDSCGDIKKANYRSSSLTDAVANVTNEVSSSKNPGCKDLVPAVTGLVGDMLGTTPIGIAGVSAMQLASGFIDKWVNHAKAKEQDDLKKLLKGTTDKLRQSSNACHYFNLSQGLLNCSRFNPPQVPGQISSCTEGSDSLSSARDSIGSLTALLGGISDKVTASTIDLNDPKSNVTEAAKLAITTKFYQQIKQILATPITFPDGSGKSGTLKAYLKTLAAAPTLPAGQEEDADVAVARKRLQALLDNVDGANAAFANLHTKDLKNDLLRTLLLVGDDLTKSPFSLDPLTGNASGLKAIAAHDLSVETSAKAAAAYAEYNRGLDNAAAQTMDAERDLNTFVRTKQNHEDLATFLKDKVDEYTNFKKLNDGKGPDDPRVMKLAENKAVQACADLAPNLYYTGTSQPNAPYESSVNSNFQSDFKSACGALFDDAPALKHLTDKSEPAPVPPTPGNFFKRNVCAAAGIKATPAVGNAATPPAPKAK